MSVGSKTAVHLHGTVPGAASYSYSFADCRPIAARRRYTLRNPIGLSMYDTVMNDLVAHTESPAGTDCEVVMLSLLRSARTVEDSLEAALGNVGLSMAKQRILGLLVDAGKPLTLSELASGADCVRSNITQLVDRLEGDGLAQRVPDPNDRRVTRAQLTPAGREAYAAGRNAMAEVGTEFSARLSAEDRQALVRALAALR